MWDMLITTTRTRLHRLGHGVKPLLRSSGAIGSLDCKKGKVMLLGFIFIGVGLVIIFDAAHVTIWELTFGLAYILFGLIGLFAG